MSIRKLSLYLVLCACFAGCTKPSAPVVTEALPYVAIARGTVDIEGGLINVATPADGIFTEISVKLGDKVSAGSVLATLNSVEAENRVELATIELSHTKLEAELLAKRLKPAEVLNKRLHDAVAAGVAEQQQADDALQAVSQLQSEIALAKSQVQIVSLKLKQAQAELARRKVLAPAAGEVIKIAAQPGGILNQDSAAFVLLPDKPVRIKAEVNENFMAKLRVGMKASVELESSPAAAPLAAHIVHIGRLLEAGHSADEQLPNRIIECLLEFEQPQNLLVGQNVMVKFYE